MFTRLFPVLMALSALAITSCKHRPDPYKKGELAAIRLQERITHQVRRDDLTFNLHGHVSSFTQLDYAGDVTDTTGVANARKQYMTFDAKGNLLTKTVYDAGGVFNSEERYQYNALNECTEQGDYNQAGEFNFSQFRRFNEKGLVTEAGERHANGEILHHATYRYDSYGNLSYSIIENKPKEEIIYKNTTNDEGVLLLQNLKYKLGEESFQATQVQEYDSLGRVVTEIRAEPSKNIDSKTVNEYDKRGHAVKSTQIVNGAVWTQKTVYYDTLGNFTGQEDINRKNGTQRKFICHYIYDSTGNWIKGTTLDTNTGTVLATAFRTYTYFK